LLLFHTGITGNEKAAIIAKCALNLHDTDITSSIKNTYLSGINTFDVGRLE